MLRDVLLGAVVLMGLGLTSGEASAVAVRCDTCRDDGHFRAEALRLGTGTHLVYNVHTNSIQQYYIQGNTSGGGGDVPRAVKASSSLSVFRQTPPAAAVQEVDRAHRVIVEGGGTLRPTYVIGVDMLGLNPSAREKTAYDYVKDANLRAMVESAAGNVNVISQVVGANVMTAVTDLLQLASNYTGLRDQARLMFKIVFKDGSYVTVIVNLEYQNGQTEVGSERTAAGQKIPTDIQEVQGEWTDYGGENLGRMATHMESLGAKMVGTGPTNSGFVRAISCTGGPATKMCLVEYMIR